MPVFEAVGVDMFGLELCSATAFCGSCKSLRSACSEQRKRWPWTWSWCDGIRRERGRERGGKEEEGRKEREREREGGREREREREVGGRLCV